MKMLLAILSLGLAFGSDTISLAHEGHTHADSKVKGTVVLVHAAEVTHIELKTTDGNTIVLTADANTKLLKGKAPATLADLKAGTRIISTVTHEGQVMKALEIQIGDTTPATETQAHSHHDHAEPPPKQQVLD